VVLPSKLAGVHDIIHISQFKKCLKPPVDEVVEDTISLKPDLAYKCYPVKILEQQDWTTRKKTTRFYKVHVIQWMMPHGKVRSSYDQIIQSFSHQGKFEPHPHIFPSLQSWDEISFKGEGCNTPYYKILNYPH
jgi:hypothetical protein